VIAFGYLFLKYLNLMTLDAKDLASAWNNKDTVDDRAIGSIRVARGENVHFRTAKMGYFIAVPY